MRIKTSELTGAALDWAVGSCENPNANPVWPFGKITWSSLWKCFTIPEPNNAALRSSWHPSADWAQGGQIIEREKIETGYYSDESGHVELRGQWSAWLASGPIKELFGPTPLVAAMRCFVTSKLGDEVEVPQEVCE
jgi:hypothetical protein